MSEKNLPMTSKEGTILFYEGQRGKVRVEISYVDETFWLTQRKMAELFGVEVNTINYHLKEVYSSGELQREATIRNFRIVRTEGKRQVTRDIEHYTLDAVISVGYRVNSIQATQFRIWATNTLQEFIRKGFVMDDERLKLNTRFGPDYFDELLERIREIRASERRFYQKITDIFAQASIDYDSKSQIARDFFATVQNKLHWAIAGKTAAEIIKDRADAEKPNMGLTTWSNAPAGKILKPDTEIAKNYLSKKEIQELDRLVSMYLDFAENQAERHIPMTMQNWVERLDAFLEFNDYDVLNSLGKVSAKVAKAIAAEQYAIFRVEQDRRFESDFDRATQKALASKKKDPK